MQRLALWEPRSLVGRARNLLIAGQHEEARAKLERAADLAPGWAEPRYLLARCAAAAGDPDAEELRYREALARAPRHEAAAAGLMKLMAWRQRPAVEAWHQFHAGNTAAATAAFSRALELLGTRTPAGSRGEILAGLGWCHYGRGAWSEARDAFLEATAADPGLIHAHKGLGMAYYRLGELDGAEAALQRALELRPGLTDAKAFIGWCAYTRARYEDALRHFTEALQSNPLAADPLWGRAWSELRLDRMTDAFESFARAIARSALHPSRHDLVAVAHADPRMADLLPKLAGALLAEGANEEVLRLLASDAEAVGFAPSAANGRPGLGLQRVPHALIERVTVRALALLSLGRGAEAGALLENLDASAQDAVLDEILVSSDGERERAAVTPRQVRGRAALAGGRTSEACSLLNAVVEQLPDSASAHCDLGEALLAAGDLDAAERQFQEVRSCVVMGERARDGIAEITRRRREPLLDALEHLVSGDPAGALHRLEQIETRLGAEDRARAEVLKRSARHRATRLAVAGGDRGSESIEDGHAGAATAIPAPGARDAP